MAQYICGLDLGQVVAPSAYAVVEVQRVMKPLEGWREPVRRVLLGSDALPLGMAYTDQVDRLTRVLDPLGDDVVVVFDRTGVGIAVSDVLREAYRRRALTRPPRGVNITGGEGSGPSHVGKGELIRALREQVLRRQLAYAPDAPGIAEVVQEAMSVEMSSTGKRRFLSFDVPERIGSHGDRLFALGLATYPRFSRAGPGARWIDSRGRAHETQLSAELADRHAATCACRRCGHDQASCTACGWGT